MNLLNAVSSIFSFQDQIPKCGDHCVAKNPNDRLVHLSACDPETHSIHPICLAQQAKEDLRCPNCAKELNSLDIEGNDLTDIEKRAVYTTMLEGNNDKPQTDSDRLIRTLSIELQIANTYIKTNPAIGLNKNLILIQEISAAIPRIPTEKLPYLQHIQRLAHQNILLASFNSCKEAKDIESLVPFFEKGVESHSIETIINLGHCLARTKATLQIGETKYTPEKCEKIAKSKFTQTQQEVQLLF